MKKSRRPCLDCSANHSLTLFMQIRVEFDKTMRPKTSLIIASLAITILLKSSDKIYNGKPLRCTMCSINRLSIWAQLQSFKYFFFLFTDQRHCHIPHSIIFCFSSCVFLFLLFLFIFLEIKLAHILFALN